MFGGMPSIEIGFLAFPRLTQLDLTGPFEVLSRVPGARVHLLARDPGPVTAEGGLQLLPTGTLADAPPGTQTTPPSTGSPPRALAHGG